MKEIIFPKEFKQKLKSEIKSEVKTDLKSEIISELENRRIRLDSTDLDFIMLKTSELINKNKPRFDNEEIVSKLLKQVILSEEQKKLAFNKDLILTKEVRADFISDILDKIPRPKDGEAGKDAPPAKDGKNYVLNDQDKMDIADSVNLKGMMTEDLFNIRNLQLIKDIQKGKIRLPAHSGASGPEVIKKIDEVLGTRWQSPVDQEFDTVTYKVDDADIISEVEGQTRWNNEDNTLDIITGLGPILQVGQELHIKIFNDTGSQIDNGTVVFPTGAFEGFPTIGKAISNTHESLQVDYGMTTQDIPNGEFGMVTWFGKVRSLDTSSFNIGDRIWVSPTVAGDITNVKPIFPDYAIQIGIVFIKDATNGMIFTTGRTTINDTFTNFWNGTIRETFNFTVSSNGSVITGILSPDNGHPDLTLFFSDGFTILVATPPKTIVLTPGSDDIPQENFVYIPKSTKVLTVSTSDWPTAEHIKVAGVILRTASTTQTDGAYKNQNHNDHIENTTSFQGHLSHMTAAIREKISATWKAGIEASATGFPTDFHIATTSGMVRQLHLQDYLATSMPTDDIHIINHPTTPNITVNNLNGQTVDTLGNTLANSSFSFVIWGIQNRTGQTSHLICNLPIGNYAKNAPSNAVSDALNFSVYDIPVEFQGVGFLIARFTLVLQADGTTWSLFDTEDLRGRVPNSTAGGGGGGTGVTTILGLTDTPSTFTGFKGSPLLVNEAETGMEFVALKTGTLASPPSGLFSGESWEDTGDSTDHPIVRISKVAT